MRNYLLLTCLTLATACAGSRASAPNLSATGSHDHEGMQLSHSEPDAPHCFTTVDNRLICPEGGAAIYSASNAQVHTLPTMELDTGCTGKRAGEQCEVKPAAPAVAEDSSSAP